MAAAAGCGTCGYDAHGPEVPILAGSAARAGAGSGMGSACVRVADETVFGACWLPSVQRRVMNLANGTFVRELCDPHVLPQICAMWDRSGPGGTPTACGDGDDGRILAR